MLKRIDPYKLNGTEQFKNVGELVISVNDLWRYAFSNLNSNVYRGALAEFLVDVALNGLTNVGIRNPWGDFDVLYKEKNLKIEVKCSSYIQDWNQKVYSKPIFSGLKAKDLYWSSAVGEFNKDNTKSYKSDFYILALLKEKDCAKLNLLDLSQWAFYILSRHKLKEITNDAASLPLIKLEKLGIKSYPYEEIKNIVDSLS